MPDDNTSTDDETSDETATPAEPVKRSLEELLDQLGDDERKAVLGEVNKARREAKNLRAKLRETEPAAAQVKALEDASRTEQERVAAAMADAERRAHSANVRVARAEVRALAARNFADPDDAAAFLDLDSYLDDDGDVDTNAIKSDLADLLERKPHLAARTNGMRPDLSQGSSGKTRPPSKPEDVFAAWWKQGQPT